MISARSDRVWNILDSQKWQLGEERECKQCSHCGAACARHEGEQPGAPPCLLWGQAAAVVLLRGPGGVGKGQGWFCLIALFVSFNDGWDDHIFAWFQFSWKWKQRWPNPSTKMYLVTGPPGLLRTVWICWGSSSRHCNAVKAEGRGEICYWLQWGKNSKNSEEIFCSLRTR